MSAVSGSGGAEAGAQTEASSGAEAGASAEASSGAEVGASAEASSGAAGRAWCCRGASASAHAARVPIRCYPDLVHPLFSMHTRHTPDAGHDMTARTHANAEAAVAPD